jgi:hypothetical protein
MPKLISATLLFLLSSSAFAGPDCSPNLRAKGLYQCESQSHEGGENRPRKVCTWSKASKECTCCISNEEAVSGSQKKAGEQEGFDKSHQEEGEELY